ncbi:MAG: response regulator, partial [Chloroflexi bacterium]|nr:response regulator [Chloroflexota bacterium]
LESEPQKGTTFYFTLPLDQSGTRVESLEYRDPLPARLEAKPLLLVATADETLVRALQRVTEAEVMASDDLQEIRRWAIQLHPRLVVLDSDDPMDDRQWPVPVLQLRLPDRRRRAKALQAQAILTKPITREIMLQALATFAPEAHTLLVVDDDSRFSELLERMLGGVEKDGGNGSKYRVLAAYTAMEALEQTQTQKIDAFILDQRLGDSLGSDLCRKIRALPGYESTPVIMVTAYDLDAMVDHPASAAKIALPEGLNGVQTLELIRNVFSSLNPRSSPLPAAEGLLTR